MDCMQAREAMSCALDAEPAPFPEPQVQAHVRSCAACEAWREGAYDVTRRVRLTGWTAAPDLTTAILADPRVADRSRRGSPSWRTSRVVLALLLLAAAAGQLALSIPLLGDLAAASDMHGMHELGVFDLALGVAFLVGAVRPRLAAGLAWPCCVAGAGLLVTAVGDVAAHHTVELHELRHLIAIGGSLLLLWSARAQRPPAPARSVTVTRAELACPAA